MTALLEIHKIQFFRFPGAVQIDDIADPARNSVSAAADF